MLRTCWSFSAVCANSTSRLCDQRRIASPELTWLSRIGAEFSMMLLISEMLVLKLPAIAWVASTSRCNAGPSPPTA